MAGQNRVVYVETEPGRFEIRNVKLGPLTGRIDFVPELLPPRPELRAPWRWAQAALFALTAIAVSVLFFIAAVVPLSALAYSFLNPELFALYFFGIVAIVSLTGKNMTKGSIPIARRLLGTISSRASAVGRSMKKGRIARSR